MIQNVRLSPFQQFTIQFEFPRTGFGLRLVSPRVVGVIGTPVDRDYITIGFNVIHTDPQRFSNPQPKTQEPMDKQGISIASVLLPPGVIRGVWVNDSQEFSPGLIRKPLTLA